MSRRALLVATPLLAASSAALQAFQSPQSPPIPTSVHSQFPSHEPALAREMVAVSHSRLERVQELLDRSPALANATWDWGFGDWETALGAASHTGRREIAMLLMAHGARPDIFTFAMLGQLDVVRAYVEASPGIQGTKGPHGLTLMLHARLGKAPAESVVAYLEEVGGADEGYATLHWRTRRRRSTSGPTAMVEEPLPTQPSRSPRPDLVVLASGACPTGTCDSCITSVITSSIPPGRRRCASGSMWRTALLDA